MAGVKQFSSAVKKELKSIEGDFDATATAGQKVATVLSKMAGELDTELDRAAQAADALSAALGPELAGRADVGQLVGDLQRMGLTFEEIVADADKLAASLKEMDAVQMKGIDSGLGGVKTKFGEIGRFGARLPVGARQHGRQRHPGLGCARRDRRVGRGGDRSDGRVHGRRHPERAGVEVGGRRLREGRRPGRRAGGRASVDHAR